MLALIVVLSYYNKAIWLAGILLFAGGLYNLFFIAFKAAEPTAMQFTQLPCDLLFPGHNNSTGEKLIGVIPEFFCIFGLVVFLTRYVRQKIWDHYKKR